MAPVPGHCFSITFFRMLHVAAQTDFEKTVNHYSPCRLYGNAFTCVCYAKSYLCRPIFYSGDEMHFAFWVSYFRFCQTEFVCIEAAMC